MALIREKGSGLQKKKIIFQQVNAPAHKHALAMGKLRDLKHELLEHRAHSPDVTPFAFRLLPNLKKFVAGQSFGRTEVIAGVDGYYSGLLDSKFTDGIHSLKERWTKFIEVNGRL